MKNLIFQSLVNDPKLKKIKHELYRKCCKTVERYAENINVDYLLTTDKYFKAFPPHFEMFRALAEKRFDSYGKILFVDADVFASNTNDNFFDYYETFSACKNISINKKRPEFPLSDDFLNSGIVLFDRNSREKIKPYFMKEMRRCKNIVPGRDQLAMNYLAFIYLGGYTRIDPTHACFLREKEAQKAILVHVAGRNRDLYFENMAFWDKHFETK